MNAWHVTTNHTGFYTMYDTYNIFGIADKIPTISFDSALRQKLLSLVCHSKNGRLFVEMIYRAITHLSHSFYLHLGSEVNLDEVKTGWHHDLSYLMRFHIKPPNSILHRLESIEA